MDERNLLAQLEKSEAQERKLIEISDKLADLASCLRIANLYIRTSCGLGTMYVMPIAHH